jgi:hypothetical protein
MADETFTFLRPKCGVCRKFHTKDCPDESSELIKQGLFKRELDDEPFDETCFEPKVQKGDREGEICRTPYLITSEFIAEQCWSRSEKKAFYAVAYFNDGKIELVDELVLNNIVHLPFNNPTLEKGLVILPEKPEECTFEQAFEEGCKLTLTMYDCEQEKVDELKFLVAIAQGSWFLDRYFANVHIPGMGAFAPIIALRGPSGSGKDRLLNALRLNSYRPFYDVSTRRIPSLYRPLDQWRGTLCLSEMDFAKGDETSELTHYLNCRSYGVPISRQNPDNPRYNEVFYNFGITIVTQRRVWEDNALEDRTIPFYCERSKKPLPTAELDEWIKKGIRLQNKLLFLRLMYWNKMVIDKSARLPGVRDHRLMAAVLPLIALSQHLPALKDLLSKVLSGIEKKRREVKAISKDGIIINELYEYWKENLIGEHNGTKYVAKEKAIGPNREEILVPLQSSDLAEKLKWSTREVRNVINSLQLHPSLETLPKFLHLDRVYRPIWVDEQRLISRFEEFVPDYSVTLVTDVTHIISDQHPSQDDMAKTRQEDSTQTISVTSVTSVTKSCEDCANYQKMACALHPEWVTVMPTHPACERFEIGGGVKR